MRKQLPRADHEPVADALQTFPAPFTLAHCLDNTVQLVLLQLNHFADADRFEAENI